MTKLVVCEKPNAAKRIAESLADGKPIKKLVFGVPYYEITRNGEKLIVAAAVGHLFNIAEKDKKAWSYPVFSYEWKPAYEVSKDAYYTKRYISALQKLAKDCQEVIISTDYDIEGSLIGYNVLRFIVKKQIAKRMKFSALTKEELLNSYENIIPELEMPIIESGETRHVLDWLWGINVSRALTLAVKNATGIFKILSTGRVQGPALSLVYKKEKEIENFKPKDYWEIYAVVKIAGKEIKAINKRGKVFDKAIVDKIVSDLKNKPAVVDKILVKDSKQLPPAPFDLTTLQVEAYKVFGISPKITSDIAQNLYLNGYISYPRTSSQKLPKMNYKKIIEKLSTLFPKEAKILLGKNKLTPTQGKKTDPAHPAIYITGEIPKELSKREMQIYELIARRFLACFGDPAVRQTMSISIKVGSETFTTSAYKFKEKGWYEIYGKYVKTKEQELPELKEGQQLKVKIIIEEKQTQPPARYTEASLVKELEKRDLGTKATRSEIIATLFERNYIKGKSIQLTSLGKEIVETLGKYCPLIIDEKLTRKFEENLEKIQNKKLNKEKVIEEAKLLLKKILENFKAKEIEIGKELSKAVAKARIEASTIGPCPVCKQGTLMLKKGKFGNFVACSNYPDCKVAINLPKGKIVAEKKLCKACSFPMVKIINKKARVVCINPDCPLKSVDVSIDEKCPKCGGKLVIRKSAYGTFIGCENYPKCKYTRKIKK